MSEPEPPSLRAEQVAQTKAALIAAGRRCFGRDGFAATSVEDLARDARVTTGALYHHFATKTLLFEAVFEAAHEDVMERSALAAAAAGTDPVEALALGFDAFLDAIRDPQLRQIIVVDAPAVLGLARFTELDEQLAAPVIADALRLATEAGLVDVADPDTLTRLLLGALSRGSMLIAQSDDPEAARAAVSATMRSLLAAMTIRTPT